MAAFTATNLLAQIGANLAQTAGSAGLNAGSRATISLGNRPVLQRRNQNTAYLRSRPWGNVESASLAVADVDQYAGLTAHNWTNNIVSHDLSIPVPVKGALPLFLQRLADPDASAELPPVHTINKRSLDNRELDKLVATLGRNNLTWKRALHLHEWLLSLGHIPDDRLCTTLMRVCSQHSHFIEALNLYEWMRTPRHEGGAGLRPSVFTYTGAMRAALIGNLPDRALKVWEDAMQAGCQTDCRMCTTLIEVCTRKGFTGRALSTYESMRQAPANSKMAPTVHAYTAAMRAAAEGGKWQRALQIWRDMQVAGCTPSGHAFAAVISACATGGQAQEATKLFNEMLNHGIQPDVVSCTALVTALAAEAQWQQARQVVDWMHHAGIKPNVRTYTAFITALGNDRQWGEALATIQRMRTGSTNVEPNAYTYSALFKAMGEQGEWKMAEEVFSWLEADATGGVRLGETVNGETSTSYTDNAALASLGLKKLTLMERTSSSASLSSNGSNEYGVVPTALAEEVLRGNSPRRDGGEGSNVLGYSDLAHHTGSSGSPFARKDRQPMESGLFSNIWGSANPESLSSLPEASFSPQAVQASTGPSLQRMRDSNGTHQVQSRSPYLNEVVCGAMMLAYERSGCWQKAVNLLRRAKQMGIEANTIMYNTAMSALGKAGEWEAAEQMFLEIPRPDTVSYETMIAAYGLAGQTRQCESFFKTMTDAGHVPRDYAFCGLVAAYSNEGNWRSALQVRNRMRMLGCTPSVHVFNALIGACERAGQLDQALSLHKVMRAEGVASDQLTHRLMESIGRSGVSAIENQQVAAAAITAAVAAAGSIIIRAGIL